MILVTGAAGFIGFHLVKKLIEKKHEVVAIDNLNDFYDLNLKESRLKLLGVDTDKNSTVNKINENLFFYKIDLIDNKSLNKIFESHKISIVFHLASHAGVKSSTNFPKIYLDNNIISFNNLIENSRIFKIKKFIYASSSSVYPNNNKIYPLKESLVCNEFKSVYAASKISNEIIANTYSKIFKINTIGLRFFSVYGPSGRPDMSYFIFFNSLYHNKQINLYNSGKIYRDFTYIDDVVKFCLKLINSENKFSIYNVGNNKPVQILDVLNKIETITGLKTKVKMLKKNREDNYATYANIDRAKLDFNYNPKWNIDEGLIKFNNWFKSFYKF